MPRSNAATAVTGRTPPSRQLRQRAAAILSREIPFVFSRKLANARFVAEHRHVATEVLQRGRAAKQTPESQSTGSNTLLGETWALPELLSPDEERSLFVALNAARHQANGLRSQLNPRRPARRKLEEVECLIAESEAIRQHLVEANVRLVVSVAGRMADTIVSFEDLFSEGLLILLKAIDGFDFSKGFRFSTYATNSLHRHFFRVRKRTLRKRQFGAPIPDEVLRGVSQGTDGVGLTPDDPTVLTREILKAARKVLDPREQKIVALRFGLEGSEHTLREIAAVLKVSKERVRQVLGRAVGKLQDVATTLRLEWTPRDIAPPVRLGV
ncbi:MAG: sigma-70 family RNA polymerase sigma factor [Planctomycetaceae bacterium]|nr:sigma-70 family RNA polymerase sigma factor [Planctomycetaceae bacterium]